MALYPLLLEPIYKEKVWGGRTLERFGRTLPGGPSTRVGESWELVDMAATSPSGGGGQPAHSRVRNGPLIKRTLNDVLDSFGPLVTGALDLGPAGSFPLLLKYLDARENLSVQVHPSPAYASDHADAHLKSEAWYIVAADPGAVIYKGVRPGTTAEAFAAAIEDDTVPELLVTVPARVGDCHYLPSGTCHALGAGILVAEVQTASDTTFRVYDWGRTDRELHIEPALACIDFGGATGGASSGMDSTTVEPVVRGEARERLLVNCDHFAIREWKLLRRARLPLESNAFSALMFIDGTGAVEWGGEQTQSLPVTHGDTVLLPAALERADIVADADLTILEVTPPVQAGA